MTSVWEGLVADAVLGTERRPYTPPQVEGPLAEVVAAAGDILDAASALWAYQQVGRLPSSDSAPEQAAPAAPDHRPLLPAGTLRSLAAIVSEPSLRGLLAEWLSLAAGDGRRLPPEWIPVLLDLAPAGLRPELEAAAGPRCAWLAAQRPDWAAAGTSPRAAGQPPTAGLLRGLPPQEAQTVLLAWLGGVHLGQAVEVLSALPPPWTAAVTDAVMGAVGALVRSGDQSPAAAAVRDALSRFALAADPRRAATVAAVAGDIERLPDDRRPAARVFWGRAVTSLNALVHFRQAMQQEFQQR